MMNYHGKKFIEIIEAARPASGFRPETEIEWRRLQRASIEAATHMYRAQGIPKAKARKISEFVNGGLAGRLLLEMSFSNPGEKDGV